VVRVEGVGKVGARRGRGGLVRGGVGGEAIRECRGVAV